MSYTKAFQPIEIENTRRVTEATWGHMAPQKNVTYRSKILFCVSDYCSGTYTLISDGMPNSPWMFDALQDFIYSFENLDTGVYEIQATFRNYRFWGKSMKIHSGYN